jgi:hypothetical protein
LQAKAQADALKNIHDSLEKKMGNEAAQFILA